MLGGRYGVLMVVGNGWWGTIWWGVEGILKIHWVDKTWVCGWRFRDWGMSGWVGVGVGMVWILEED